MRGGRLLAVLATAVLTLAALVPASTLAREREPRSKATASYLFGLSGTEDRTPYGPKGSGDAKATPTTPFQPANIDVGAPADVDSIRQKLVDYIWGSAGFPSSAQPASVQIGITDSYWSDVTSIQRIDKLTMNPNLTGSGATVQTAGGLRNVAYLFRPKSPNNRLMIYHHGHDGTFKLGKATIKYFLDRGYTVLGMSMIGDPASDWPYVRNAQYGTFRLWSHYYYGWLETPTYSPIRLFVQSIAEALNYAVGQQSWGQISMVGVSGGGWETHVYSALDTRIQKSYPVAGSLPFYLRNDYNPGDYEQQAPGLYYNADYLELYTLASYGLNRNQMQILNLNDTCCFKGSRYQAYPYESLVQDKLTLLAAGRFNVYVDNTSAHAISPNALNVIASDLDS